MEEIEKNEEIIMVELQSEDGKKAKVVGKTDNNKDQATKKQTENKNMILNKDENIENTKSEGEANNRVENVGEIIQDKVPVEIANKQPKAKQQNKDIVANKRSNNHQQKKITGNGQRKKVEEPKYSDSEQQVEDGKTYNVRSTSTREKIETKKKQKEDNINSELAKEKNTDINNRDVCSLCNRPVRTGIEWGGGGDVVDGFITNVKEQQRKEYAQETLHLQKRHGT